MQDADMPSDVRMTVAVARVLREFLADVSQPRHGYDLMQATGYPSGKVYPVLGRLTGAGWLTRTPEEVDPSQAGRPARYLYRLTAGGAVRARQELAVLSAQLSVSPERRLRLQGEGSGA
jgi:PadR family transcriptional regulator, regulatory protein PadR